MIQHNFPGKFVAICLVSSPSCAYHSPRPYSLEVGYSYQPFFLHYSFILLPLYSPLCSLEVGCLRNRSPWHYQLLNEPSTMGDLPQPPAPVAQLRQGIHGGRRGTALGPLRGTHDGPGAVAALRDALGAGAERIGGATIVGWKRPDGPNLQINKQINK